MGTVDGAGRGGSRPKLERRRRLDEVIHELRTPLAVAGTNLELAADDPAIDPDTGRLIDAARRAADRMRRTVDDLAEHGRLSRQPSRRRSTSAPRRAPWPPSTCRPGPSALPAPAARPARPTCRLPAGDRAAVRTTLGNLTSNAVRLAPGGSSSRVSCGELGGWAWVAVTDEGPGIAASDCTRASSTAGGAAATTSDRDRSSATRPARARADHHAPAHRGARRRAHHRVARRASGTTFTVWLPLDRRCRRDRRRRRPRPAAPRRPGRGRRFTDDLAGRDADGSLTLALSRLRTVATRPLSRGRSHDPARRPDHPARSHAAAGATCRPRRRWPTCCPRPTRAATCRRCPPSTSTSTPRATADRRHDRGHGDDADADHAAPQAAPAAAPSARPHVADRRRRGHRRRRRGRLRAERQRRRDGDHAHAHPVVERRRAIPQPSPRALGPAVVQIEVGGGIGSGVIYDTSGLILTAHHVVASGDEVTVRTADNRELAGPGGRPRARARPRHRVGRRRRRT